MGFRVSGLGFGLGFRKFRGLGFMGFRVQGLRTLRNDGFAPSGETGKQVNSWLVSTQAEVSRWCVRV